MKNAIPFSCTALVVFLFCSGCATSKNLPRTYLDTRHDLTVTVVKIPEKPQMMDSGGGGLIGMMVTSTTRKSTMKEMMEGIQGETVKELTRQEINRLLQDRFNLVDSSDDLKLNVRIDTYGFFVPTTVAGIKTGAYQFQITGYVEIRDAKLGSKKVAFVNGVSQSPLGNKPTQEAVPGALADAIKQFSENTVNYLISGKHK
jgi:hypothetical protein